jgi:hypothetical protein
MRIARGEARPGSALRARGAQHDIQYPNFRLFKLKRPAAADNIPVLVMPAPQRNRCPAPIVKFAHWRSRI